MKNVIEIEASRVIGFRPTPYDVGVLMSIHESHPELPDASSLIRKALREYQTLRENGGGMKVKTSTMLDLIYQVIELLRQLTSDLNYVKSKLGDCDNPPGSE